MKMNKKYVLKGGLGLTVVAVIVSLGLVLSSSSLNYFEINKQLEIFANVYREVNVNYVDETHPEELMEDAIGNMLKNLDPYTVHIAASDIENYRMMQTGQYGGIGATIMKYKEYCVITSPKKGFPADKAGLKSGDLLIAAEGKDMKDKSPDELSSLLKGSPGTTIDITIERDGERKTLTLIREDIQLPSVPYFGMLNDETGYITLSSFTDKASKEISEALHQLKAEYDVKSLVLDLRSNPGGLLSEAINVSNIFLDKGVKVVETRGRTEETNRAYRTLKAPIDNEIPLVVLINDRSASASEIVAGTMQDLDRGVVMGQQSFGKGLVQQTKPLSYGSQIKITIAKYYTPSGRCVQAINYAERDESGKVKRLPDSLRTEFKTAGGRTVLDGAGVDPDINLESKEYPHILMSLVRNHLVFEYVNLFEKQNPEITSAKEFRLTDKDYDNFVKFLTDKEYHYDTDTEKMYTVLRKVSEDEAYEGIDKELKALKSAIAKSKSDDLMKYKPIISNYIEGEIIERYYYESGRIEHEVFTDEEVSAALNLLSNPSDYAKIFAVAE
jgi:carboxyl-terminal processing protease